MKNNTFFLRKEYRLEEMIDRIHTNKINPGNQDFDSVLTQYELDPQSFSGMNKGDFFRRIHIELEEDYEDFIQDLYDSCGQPGDTFNLQLFELPEERDYTVLYDVLADLEGSRLDEHCQTTSRELLLSIIEQNEGTIDLGLKTSEKVQDIEPDEDLKVTIERADTGEIEARYGPDYIIKAPSQNLIEARIFPEDQLVAVSNGSGITDGVQNDIVNAIIELGES